MRFAATTATDMVMDMVVLAISSAHAIVLVRITVVGSIACIDCYNTKYLVCPLAQSVIPTIGQGGSVMFQLIFCAGERP